MTDIQFVRNTVLEKGISHIVREEALNRLLVMCGGGEMMGNSFLPRTVREKIEALLADGEFPKASLLFKNEMGCNYQVAKELVQTIEGQMKERE